MLDVILFSRALRRLAGAVCVGLILGGAVGVAAPSQVAQATPAPVATPTATELSADALPTVQIDGVVWSQAVVGNTVFAGGSFANARPAGAAPGTQLTARANLLSYNITTGVLNGSFAPSLNAQVRTVAASPDGSRIYVGGDFTTANGQVRNRIAAYDTATNKLVASFAPVIDGSVRTISATNSTVYVGGQFTNINGLHRVRLAAINASNGSLTSWAPSADYTVSAMVLTPDGSRLIVGGSFQYINSTAAYGLAALDTVSGTVQPWEATNVVRDATTTSGITSLVTDGSAVYGTGYVWTGGKGTLEGTFSADPNSGRLNWIEDCHGDSYSTFPFGDAVYTVSHSHACDDVGGFPETVPRSWHRAVGFTKRATGTLDYFGPAGYHNFAGTPSPTMLNWFPDYVTGTYTKQNQASWSISGNTTYVVTGGEFLSVNNVAQQGLARFTTRQNSPHTQGPRVIGANLNPTVVSQTSGTVRVSFAADWDRDDTTLSYQLVRDSNTTHPIYTATVNAPFWARRDIVYTDTGLTVGSVHKYRVWVTDPSGNTVSSDNVSVTVGGYVPSSYARDVRADGAAHYWRLDEVSGKGVADAIGTDDLALSAPITRQLPGAIVGDADTASNLPGTVIAASTDVRKAPDIFTAEAWFRTTSTTGGALLGFGDSQSGTSRTYDREVYFDSTGHVLFGVGTTNHYLSSPNAYNDGQWHYVSAQLSSAGTALYLDGQRIAADATITSGRVYNGYWHVGGNTLGSWPGQRSSTFFTGDIDDVALYPSALSASQIAARYADSGRTLSRPTASAGPTASR